jgi:hypothetical protein
MPCPNCEAKAPENQAPKEVELRNIKKEASERPRENHAQNLHPLTPNKTELRNITPRPKAPDTDPTQGHQTPSPAPCHAPCPAMTQAPSLAPMPPDYLPPDLARTLRRLLSKRTYEAT